MLSDPSSRLCLTFLLHKLKAICTINRMFQADVSDPSKLSKDFVIYYRPLLQQIVLPAQRQCVVKDDELLEFEVENHHASFCNVLCV